MRDISWDLLQGAVDLHYHGYPEVSLDVLCAHEDVENLRMARDAGMRGIVVKSHMWPTMDKVHYLSQMVEGLDIFSSISLNTSTGGVRGYVAESAVRQGAKVIWLPTWSSRNDMEKNVVINFMRNNLEMCKRIVPEDCLCICKEDGSLTEGMMEVLEVVQANDVLLATGHISCAESMAVFREAKSRGIRKLVFTHPFGRSIGADVEIMKEAVGYGALVEFTFLSTLPTRAAFSVNVIADTIKKLGAENCVLTSDHFNSWSPSVSEMMRLFVTCLLDRGIPEQDIRTMIVENPVRLLY